MVGVARREKQFRQSKFFFFCHQLSPSHGKARCLCVLNMENLYSCTQQRNIKEQTTGPFHHQPHPCFLALHCLRIAIWAASFISSAGGEKTVQVKNHINTFKTRPCVLTVGTASLKKKIYRHSLRPFKCTGFDNIKNYYVEHPPTLHLTHLRISPQHTSLNIKTKHKLFWAVNPHRFQLSSDPLSCHSFWFHWSFPLPLGKSNDVALTTILALLALNCSLLDAVIWKQSGSRRLLPEIERNKTLAG